MDGLDSGDTNGARLPNIATPCFSQPPVMATKHGTKDHQSSGNQEDVSYIIQNVSPGPDNHVLVENVDEVSCLMPTTGTASPLAANPVYPLSPAVSSVAQPQLDVAAHNTSKNDLTTFDLTIGSDDLATDQLFSGSMNPDLEFSYMDFESEQIPYMEYAVDFDLPPSLLEVPMSAESESYEPLTPEIHDHPQKPTSIGEGRRASSLSNKISNVPRLINDMPPKPQPIYMDERKRAHLVADFTRRTAYRYDTRGDFPDCPSLLRYLTQFFQSFNSHLPIFHIPTFDPSRNPSPLVLAMCSLGAMFQLERRKAGRLRKSASSALDKSDCLRQLREPGTARPAWMVQCKLLLLFGAILGGDAADASSALEDIGYLHQEFTTRKATLLIDCEEHEVFSLSWQEWIGRESSKRLLFGIVILSSLLTITYNISPGLSTSCDLDLELPEEERLWTASTAEAWKDAISSTRSMKRLSASHVLTQLLFGKGLDTASETRLGLFAALVLVHAVNIYAWHVSQSTNSFTNFLTDRDLEDQVARRSLSQVEAVLDRCKQVFARSRRIEDGPPDPSESPLPFNSLNLLRSCYARVLCDGWGFRRALLLSDSDSGTSLAAKRFVQKSEFNMPLLTKIVAFMVEALMMPSHLGHLVIRKTAALTWSIEMAITLWDCGMDITLQWMLMRILNSVSTSALYSTKWVQMIFRRVNKSNSNPMEQKIMDGIRHFTSHCQEEKMGRLSPAAILADTFAAHFDEVWVWQGV